MQLWKHKSIINNPVCLQPSPIVMGDFIRVFAGHFPTKDVISNIGFFDYYPETDMVCNTTLSVLSPAEPGMFDSFGAVPTCVINNRSESPYYLMYYAGYQRLQDVRFCVFGGLAYSEDCVTFNRYSDVPICDRTHDNSLFHVIHSVVPMRDWKGWYHAWVGGGGRFIRGINKTLPVYNIQYLEIGIDTPIYCTERVCVYTRPPEHRVGRPTVLYDNGKYRMWFCYGTEATYNIGYAESTDPGGIFHRMDNDVCFEYEAPLRAYPAVVEFKDKLLMFYNLAYGESLIQDPKIMVAELC